MDALRVKISMEAKTSDPAGAARRLAGIARALADLEASASP